MVYTSCLTCAKQRKTDDFTKLGNIRNVSQPPSNDSLVPSPPVKMKILLISQKTLEKQKLKFFRSALYPVLHMITRVSPKYFGLLYKYYVSEGNKYENVA